MPWSSGELDRAAGRILDRDPSPPVRVRLLRDVLGVPPDGAELGRAREQLHRDPSVTALIREQRTDGGWGRFHSRDVGKAAHVPTTEWAIERARALGLDTTHPALDRAAAYLVGLLEGRVAFPDPPERNDRWPAGVRLFTAATLALLRPDHPAIEDIRRRWWEIARRTFASGVYDADAEAIAHRELTGATVRGSYLTIRNRYAVRLLAPTRWPTGDRDEAGATGPRTADIARPLATWLLGHRRGIGYLDVPLSWVPDGHGAGRLDRWLRSHELVTALGHPAPGFEEWIRSRRDPDGLWDLGARSPGSPCLPLSRDRRSRRRVDWSVWILTLLAMRLRHERV